SKRWNHGQRVTESDFFGGSNVAVKIHRRHRAERSVIKRGVREPPGQRIQPAGVKVGEEQIFSFCGDFPAAKKTADVDTVILDPMQPNVTIIAEMESELTFEREVHCVKFQTKPAGRVPPTARGNDATVSVVEAGRSRIDAQVSA